MSGTGGFLKRLGAGRVVSRWAEAAARADSLNLRALRQERDIARAVRPHLDAVLRTADTRLSLPVQGGGSLPGPAGSDWVWRPDVFSGLIGRTGLAPVPAGSKFGTDVTVFHDCKQAEIAARHVPNLSDRDLAPYALTLDVLEFDGGFLSVVIDLPKDVAKGLAKDHILQLDCGMDIETGIDLFARLNFRQGPNTEQMPQELHPLNGSATAEFDLAYSNLNEKRVEQVWLDLIFENPRMNRIVLRDIVLSRRGRAAL